MKSKFGYLKTLTQKREAMLRVLLANRCENHGYDWKAFRRIKTQRSAARSKARQFLGRVDCLHWEQAPLARRIDWSTMSYTVEQSQNEEITNLLRQLVNPKASWLS